MKNILVGVLACLILNLMSCASSPKILRGYVLYDHEPNKSQQTFGDILSITGDSAQANTVMPHLKGLLSKQYIYRLDFQNQVSEGSTQTNQKKIKSITVYNRVNLDHFIIETVSNTIAKEQKKAFDWIISEDTKSIGGYQCQKAATQNNGMLIEAWFAKEIKCSFGPNYYHGLDGLILELSSQGGEKYSFKSIEFEPHKEEIKVPKL